MPLSPIKRREKCRAKDHIHTVRRKGEATRENKKKKRKKRTIRIEKGDISSFTSSRKRKRRAGSSSPVLKEEKVSQGETAGQKATQYGI